MRGPSDESALPDSETLLHEIQNLSDRITGNPDRRGEFQIDFYKEMQAKYGTRGAHFAMVLRTLMVERSKVEINATNSNIGNINTGTLIGDVNVAIRSLSASSDDATRHLAEALEALTTAIQQNQELAAPSKTEALELVSVIAAEAQRPPDQRKLGVVKAALKSLPQAVSTVKALTDIWTTVGPTMTAFFSG